FAKGATEGGIAETKSAAKADAAYSRISTVEELGKLVKSLFDRDRFAFALQETADGKLAGVAFSTSPGVAVYFDFASLGSPDDQKDAIKLLKEIFDNGLIEKSTHDLKRAIHVLGKLGIKIETATDDTLLQAYLLDTERAKYELTTMANEYLGGYGLAKEQ